MTLGSHALGADDAIETNSQAGRPSIRRAWYYSVISRYQIDLILFPGAGRFVCGWHQRRLFSVAARLLQAFSYLTSSMVIFLGESVAELSSGH